jgi:hypothetical protein
MAVLGAFTLLKPVVRVQRGGKGKKRSRNVGIDRNGGQGIDLMPSFLWGQGAAKWAPDALKARQSARAQATALQILASGPGKGQGISTPVQQVKGPEGPARKAVQGACAQMFHAVTDEVIESRSRRPSLGMQHVYLDGSSLAALMRSPHVTDMLNIGKQIDAGEKTLSFVCPCRHMYICGAVVNPVS